MEALNALVQALRTLQAVSGDRPWLVVDLTMVQLKAVMLLVQTGGMPSCKLAAALGIGPSAVTALVDRLRRQRLVRRAHDRGDRRVVWIRPTPQAIAVNGRLLHIRRSLLAEVLRRVPSRDRAAVNRSVRLLLQGAKQMLASGAS